MSYVRSKMHPRPKSGPLCVIERNGLSHAITIGNRTVNTQILLRVHKKIMKCHVFSTQSDANHRQINIF